MRTIMLAGSGSNGKTRCVQELEAKLTALGKTCRVVLSTTRQTMARLGFTTEKAGLDLPMEQQMMVQEEVFSDFRKALVESAQTASAEGIEYLLVDRSPFDYNAYVCQTQPDRNEAQLSARHAQALDTMWSLERIGKVYLFLLPWNPPWKGQIQARPEDTYRHAPAGKNYAWSAAIEAMIRDAEDQLLSVLCIRHKVVDLAPSSADRAENILETIHLVESVKG